MTKISIFNIWDAQMESKLLPIYLLKNRICLNDYSMMYLKNKTNPEASCRLRSWVESGIGSQRSTLHTLVGCSPRRHLGRSKPFHQIQTFRKSSILLHLLGQAPWQIRTKCSSIKAMTMHPSASAQMTRKDQDMPTRWARLIQAQTIRISECSLMAKEQSKTEKLRPLGWLAPSIKIIRGKI